MREQGGSGMKKSGVPWFLWCITWAIMILAIVVSIVR